MKRWKGKNFKLAVFYSFFLILCSLSSILCSAQETVAPIPVPVVRADTLPALAADRDTAWYGICAVIPLDSASSFYTGVCYNDTDMILSLSIPAAAPFDDPAMWVWDDTMRIYRPEPPKEMSMRLFFTVDPLADIAFTDVWQWHARRSVTAGYADDFYAVRTTSRVDSPFMVSLVLPDTALIPDRGNPAWMSRFYGRRMTPRVPRFFPAAPAGSMSDVRTSARWEAGFWTIEFKRRRITGNPDDIPFNFDDSVRFQIAIDMPDSPRILSPILVIPGEIEPDEEYLIPLPDLDDAERIATEAE